jgi:DNA-binding transcriptional LysR family regulator
MQIANLRHGDFRRIDLNLLVAFDALMLDQSVGRAAERVFLGQPAMSHVLARLREALGDPLFVRTGNLMKPTAFARALAPRVHAWLEEAAGFLLEGATFDPGSASGVVRIAVPDGIEALLLPQLLAELATDSPGIVVRAHPVEVDQLLPALDAEQIDLAVGGMELPVRAWHEQRPLFESRFVCVYSRQCLSLPARPSLKALAECRHVAHSYRGGSAGLVDEFFEAHGLTRRIAAVSTSLLAIRRILASAPLVSLQPEIYRPIFADDPDMVIAPIGGEKLRTRLGLTWHRRDDAHPMHAYLRERILDLTTRLRRRSRTQGDEARR